MESFSSRQLDHPVCSVIQGSIASCLLYTIFTAEKPLELYDHEPYSSSQEAVADEPTAITYVDDVFVKTATKTPI